MNKAYNTEYRLGSIFLVLIFIVPFLMAGYVLVYKVKEKPNNTITTIERGFVDGFEYSIFVDKTNGKRYMLRGGSVTPLDEFVEKK